MEFEKRVVVITGGTRGIGSALSRSFLAKGAIVYATYSSNDSAAEAFRAEMKEATDRLILKKFDVGDSEAVKTFFKTLESEQGKIDILVNNSGIRRDGLAMTMEISDWEAVLRTNLQGSFLMSKNAIGLMMSKKYGRIINISSVGGKMGLPGQANYAASKAGQIAMSKSLAKEVAKKRITVNNVCPGFIETELLSDLPPEQVAEYKKQVPMKRFGTGEEVAAAVLFLASEEASYITGTSIDVCGGLL